MTVTATTRGVLRGPVAPAHGQLLPLGLDEVTITAGIWAFAQERNRRNTIPHILHWLDEAGWAGNFDAAAAGDLPSARHGREFSDSEIYKALEALVWQVFITPDATLEERYHALVQRIAGAQEPDGYLNTNFGRPGQANRYSDLEWGHELYCYGHLLQAAAARLRTGHDDLLVEVARAAADHVCVQFGADGNQGVCGHPEVELGLVEFGRATGDRRYIEQAARFIDRRGHHTLRDIEFGRSYYQDDVPFRDATSLRGHAVRAVYLAAAAVDVAIEHNDANLLRAAAAQWEHARARRTYVTGGIGSQHQGEAFGEDFALPSDRAYAETCAGIGSVMLSWRLLLATGGSTYADMIERTLYNAVAASPSLDGRAFYYTNTLHQRTPGSTPATNAIVPRATSSLRAPWFEVSCCPTNVARTIASLGAYLATKDRQGVQLHQYAEGTIATQLPDGRPIKLTVNTDYPSRGAIVVTSTARSVGEWTLTLRVPHWATGARITDQDGIRQVAPGTVTITRDFHPGDTVRLDLPLSARLTFPDPRIDGVRGCVAVESGPLVLCAESTDLPSGSSTEQLTVDSLTPLEDSPSRSTTGVVPWASANGFLRPEPEHGWPYGPRAHSPSPPTPTSITFIPYYQWANRGPSTMRVWIPTTETAAR